MIGTAAAGTYELVMMIYRLYLQGTVVTHHTLARTVYICMNSAHHDGQQNRRPGRVDLNHVWCAPQA